MSMKIFISCDEATTICNKSQYKEASFWEIIKLKIHVFSCKICGRYSKQNATLTKVCDKHLNKTESERKLCEEEKEAIQTEVVKKINSNP
ncbi:hypothetical protein [Aureibaculum conchae]|uniref:hypothetical protein n=1 Tax=Aureibaculum sp. 2308TA14-22 TaxID=3108392 RepID=UPI003395B993